MTRYVDKCEVCEPISRFLDFLEKAGFKIITEKISDYHFKELYFKVAGHTSNILLPEKINKVSENIFMCECHWSMVELTSD